MRQFPAICLKLFARASLNLFGFIEMLIANSNANFIYFIIIEFNLINLRFDFAVVPYPDYLLYLNILL